MIDMEQNSRFNTMQQLKRSLFALRNGVIADSLRKAGCPHKIVFGLNLPQLNEIAAQYGPSEELAEALWADTALRESALLAPMLYPKEKLTLDKARELCARVMWHEDADILCFKLLRDAPFAPELAKELVGCDVSRMARYTGLRLYLSMLAVMPPAKAKESPLCSEALSAATSELERPDAISTLASMLKEEVSFLINPDGEF